ncbi:S-layer homology domain-containing protein [Paenibacillus thalictri]|uniref:S-layer homology domain-containing protein n=1 Tax=Paenibacillus thalictri TaxID=2527873 RepID=A0A4Q9DSS7_9BACL|nr:S-layer homology domain-containing protein [Paenibacillus thalictri]TBL77392.1 S-layer homology domain-containing protein [Paenibacillus thalictri]
MVDNNKDEAELQASQRKRSNLDKYSKVARTSMLAITMGMNWNPAISTAANNGGSNPSDLPTQQVAAAAPIQYQGNSLEYFRNQFLPLSSFHSLTFGENAPTATVSIQGTAVVGQTLIGSYQYADAEGDPEDVSVTRSTYQWYSSTNGITYVPITNATSYTYTLTPSDAGKYIEFEVTPYSTVEPKAGTPTKSLATAMVGPAPTAPTATVSIQGLAVVGQTLIGSYQYADAEGDPEDVSVTRSTYQWYSSTNGITYVPIASATSHTYTLTPGDVGKYIEFEVTPYSTVEPKAGIPTKSSATAIVGPTPTAPTAPTATVSIQGSAVVGQTLIGSYQYADAEGDPEDVSVTRSTYQWYSSINGIAYVPIANATSNTYTLTPGDVGKYIEFEVTPYSTVEPKAGIPTKSLATAIVGPAPTAPTAIVSIQGTAIVGQTLIGSYQYADAEGNPEDVSVTRSTYQWYSSTNGITYVPIANATSHTYTLTFGDVGKYIEFEVTPYSTVEPKAGIPTKSAPTAAVIVISSSSRTGTATGGTGTTTPVTPAPVTPSPQEETLIEVVAVKKNVETKESAKLILTKDEDGSSLATFHIYTDGVVQSSQEANKKETIAVRAKTLMDARVVYADIAGNAIETLTSNQQRLAILTGDVAIEFPAASLRINDLVKQSGVVADKLKVEIKIEKQPAAVKEAANQWASLQKATVIGEPYKFSILMNNGSSSQPIVQYGNRYAYQTVPIPKGVGNLNSLGAVMLLDGKYVSVPVRIVDSEHALIQTPTNATVMLIQRNENFPDTANHWGKNDIRLMADKGNVDGDKQGNYNPDVVVTRAEFADLLVRSFGLGHLYNGTAALEFKDLPADAGVQEKIRIAVGAGLFTGISADKFAPDQAVTREQMITVLMRFYNEFGLEVDPSIAPNLPPDFSDKGQISGWANADVKAAAKAGIINGYEDDTIRALRTGTRAEVAALIRRFLHTTNLTN